MKVLVTGGSGQLAGELRSCLAAGRCEIGAVPREFENVDATFLSSAELDITDASRVASCVLEGGYDLVVNCAAYTNVDACEAHEESAYQVNAVGPRNLARACQEAGARLVHLSTDYVFAGNDPRPRVEEDPTSPISAYGRTKLAGEEFVVAECARHYIVRTAWLYGRTGHNFVKTMLRLGAQRDEVMVVDDQLGNPTNANDLVYEILRIAATDDYGIYHCTGEGTCSWADFASSIMEGAGLGCRVVRCTSEQYRAMNPTSAKRPSYSSLENRRLSRGIGNNMRQWQDALGAYLGNLRDMA